MEKKTVIKDLYLGIDALKQLQSEQAQVIFTSKQIQKAIKFLTEFCECTKA